TYEPKPSDIKALSDTRALFLVGGGLEMFAPDMVKATEKTFPVIEVNSGIEIINGFNNGASSDPGNTAGNPHIWLSLRNAQIIVRNIANALSQIDPAGSTKYRENAELYIQKLEDLDAWFRKESEKIAVKDFVTQHAAWVYFARDYGFVQKGVIADTPGKEPSPKEIRKLVDTIKNLGISVIFAEPQLNQKAAETLAQETGMKVAILDPLGRYPDQPYLELMKTNMQIIIQYMK
ncbi:MAG: metal ABC transporter substrate-binding protein, partial [Atribacterota bacterium]